MVEEREMSFLEHLEELRWHVVRSLSVLMVLTVTAFFFIQRIYDEIIFAPTRTTFPTFQWLCKLGQVMHSEESLCIKDLHMKIINRTMMGQFTMALVSSFIAAMIVAFPYLVWEIWRFIKPGLHITEKRYSRGAVAAISFMFLTGAAFGYFIMSPLAVYFFSNFQLSSTIDNEFDVSSYVTTIISLILGSGILFQLPIVVYFLSQVGIVTPALLRQFRKHAIVVILVVGAVVTPPDPLSQVLISVPLYFLYEFSIFISGYVARKKAKQDLLDDIYYKD